MAKIDDDYISREVAIDTIDSLYFDTVDDHNRTKERIKRVPSADVRENVKGFWYALNKGDRGYSAGDFCCSICGKPNNTWIQKPNFCQNCGADMREETK